jgi:hypothetical protein
MPSPTLHTSLRVRTNLVLACVWLAALLGVVLWFGRVPWTMISVGIVGGMLQGSLQRRAGRRSSAVVGRALRAGGSLDADLDGGGASAGQGPLGGDGSSVMRGRPCLLAHVRIQMRRAWLFAACASIGCAHVSTSDYRVAAGFAAAAGALQVAELANQGPASRTCGPRTCQGCCDLADHCVDGSSYDACGTGGSVCRDCQASGQLACSQRSCSAGTSGGWSPARSVSAVQGGAAPGARASSPPCGRPVLYCFLGTAPVCVTDDTGCQLCSCTPDSRFDWVAPR